MGTRAARCGESRLARVIPESLLRVLLVGVGGMLGTAARLGLGLLLPDEGFPWSILTVNLCGSLLIGVLAARLPASSRVRLLLGTGLLGGFTTYSAFTAGSWELWGTAPLLAVLYAGGSVVLGVTAAALGLRIGRRRERGA